MLKQALEILEHMDQTDVNVIALKQLLSCSESSAKVYMLYYKGEPLRFTSYGNGDAEFCNATTFELTTDKTDPIWTTNNLIAAVYNKYIQTPWFNSTETTLSHNFKPEDLEVRDTEGKVYNRKPLSYYTVYKLRKEIWGWNDPDIRSILNDPKSKTTYVDKFYEQCELLAEAKERYSSKKVISKMSLSQLQDYRKNLIQEKGKLVSENKSYKAIQKRLDKVNARITELSCKV